MARRPVVLQPRREREDERVADAPPLLVLIVGGERLTGALHSVALIIVAQLVIGAEFLASHPRSYVSKAFEFTRAFFYRWTVNWKFVSEPLFLSATFARGSWSRTS